MFVLTSGQSRRHCECTHHRAASFIAFRKLDALGHDIVVEFCNVSERKNECVVLNMWGK